MECWLLPFLVEDSAWGRVDHYRDLVLAGDLFDSYVSGMLSGFVADDPMFGSGGFKVACFYRLKFIRLMLAHCAGFLKQAAFFC